MESQEYHVLVIDTHVLFSLPNVKVICEKFGIVKDGYWPIAATRDYWLRTSASQHKAAIRQAKMIRIRTTAFGQQRTIDIHQFLISPA